MIQWKLKRFEELTTTELYKIIQLRIAVFVVEQDCVFQDLDDKDLTSWHLTAWQDSEPVAYARILAPGISYEEASIGRVITSTAVRGKGMGRELLQRSIDVVYQLFNTDIIRIGAQLYLKKFYEEFGFSAVSDVYLEDGIEHLVMVRTTM